MYSSRVTQAITDFSELYGVAEKAYKRLQTLLGKIDDKVHNEFRYCSRGLKEFVVGLPAATEDESIDRLQKATHAIKNAFNDSVDLILGYAALKISEFSDIDSGKELILYIPNLGKIIESIRKINSEIAASREDITNRIAAYKKIIESPEFEVVVNFCELIPVLENNISTDFGREVKAGRRFVIGTSLTALGILIGFVGAVEKLPEFLRWLSKWYPSLVTFL